LPNRLAIVLISSPVGFGETKFIFAEEGNIAHRRPFAMREVWRFLGAMEMPLFDKF